MNWVLDFRKSNDTAFSAYGHPVKKVPVLTQKKLGKKKLTRKSKNTSQREIKLEVDDEMPYGYVCIYLEV